MKVKRFTIRGLLVTALLTLVLTLALVLGGLYLALGKTGLAVTEAMALIHTQFVGQADVQKAADAALGTLVTGLEDRWSYYVDEAGYQRLRESQNNAYVGLGCTVTYPDEAGLLVKAVLPGGPADLGGVVPGDLILVIDSVPMEGETRQNASQYTRGEEGSLAELLIRKPDGTERWLNLTRTRVEEHPVSDELLPDGTGLVRLKNFNRRLADEAMAAVDELVAQGAQRLVFDVRNNGGGYLDELTRLLDHLLPQGVIFRASDRAGRTSSVTSDETCVDLPMAVLVNGGTYSAAEFFAAQLQESGSAVLVGELTFGKGYSQQTFPLLTGGALNISTAKYFTGGGVSLIGTGLTLDQELTLTEDQAALLAGDALSPEEDPQLQAALALLLE